MLREIKFRGLQKDGKFAYGKLLSDSAIGRWGNSEIYSYANVDNNTVGQFTGLLDKNAIEIYEDDLIKISMGHSDWTDEIFEVFFMEGSFCFRPIGTDKFTSFITYSDQMHVNRGHRNISQFIEIIGNIHKHLL